MGAYEAIGYYTIEESMAATGLSRPSLYRRINSGAIRAEKVQVPGSRGVKTRTLIPTIEIHRYNRQQGAVKRRRTLMLRGKAA